MVKIAFGGGLLALTVLVSGAAAQAQQTAPASASSALYAPAATLPSSHWAYGALNRVWSAATGAPVTEAAGERSRRAFAQATVQVVRRLSALPSGEAQTRLSASDKQTLASLVREFTPEIVAARADTQALSATLARMGVAAQLPAQTAAPLRDTPFPDVPTDHWAFESVEKVRKAGVVQGYPGGQGPSAQASKARVATAPPVKP